MCDSDAHREMRYVCVSERLHNSFMYHYLAIVDVHRLNINQYLLRIVAKGTISIQRYKDWTLTYLYSYKKNRVGDDGVPAILQYRPSDLYPTDRKETMEILQKDTHTPLRICK